VQLTVKRALEDAEMRGGAERQGAQAAPQKDERDRQIFKGSYSHGVEYIKKQLKYFACPLIC